MIILALPRMVKHVLKQNKKKVPGNTMVLISFCLILFALCSMKNITHFLDKDIRIFVSTANHIFLAKNTESNRIVPKSKFGNLDNIYSIFKIAKDGNEFRLFSGEDRICSSGGTITKCRIPKAWTITNVTLGYTFSEGNKCLTVSSYDTLGMTTCTNSDDQIFDFKGADDDQDCDDNEMKKKKKDNNTIVINLTTDGKKQELHDDYSHHDSHIMHTDSIAIETEHKRDEIEGIGYPKDMVLKRINGQSVVQFGKDNHFEADSHSHGYDGDGEFQPLRKVRNPRGKFYV